MTDRIMQIAVLFVAGFALFSAGCESTGARRIDSSGTQTITTVSGLDIQDASDAAGALASSLLESGILGRGGKPSTIAIDRYINNTSQQIDRDRIIKKIRVTLNRAGVAQTMTSLNSMGNIGGESNIASKAAQERKETAEVDAFLDDQAKPKALKPDYSLTFKLLENKVRSGRIRQTTYIFQMSLNDIKTGLAVWEDEKRITKQGRKASVGW